MVAEALMIRNAVAVQIMQNINDLVLNDRKGQLSKEHNAFILSKHFVHEKERGCNTHIKREVEAIENILSHCPSMFRLRHSICGELKI